SLPSYSWLQLRLCAASVVVGRRVFCARQAPWFRHGTLPGMPAFGKEDGHETACGNDRRRGGPLRARHSERTGILRGGVDVLRHARGVTWHPQRVADACHPGDSAGKGGRRECMDKERGRASPAFSKEVFKCAS